MTDGTGTPIQGYSRDDVDQFLAAATEERMRLEAEIDDLQQRVGRARSAIGMHRVMVAMLLETQRELTEMRDAAAAQADQIVRDAEAEVEALRAATAGAPVGSSSAMSSSMSRPASEPSIDLVAEPVSAWASASTHPSLEPVDAGEVAVAPPANDEYMEFLRGALADDTPLGPVGE